MDFIPAKESPLFIRLFRVYVKWFFKWRFKKIWIHQKYTPSASSRTVYFLNHTSWWDGLIPFLMNEYRFHQQARAFMEVEQMEKYAFFKKIGVFSIDPGNQIHTLHSMRYAVKSMQRHNSSLFIYPQGEIQPIDRNIIFKPGISWLHSQLKEVDFVPIGIQIQTVHHNKPELHIWVDDPIEVDSTEINDNIIHIFENNMQRILSKLFDTAGFKDKPYESFF